MSDFDTALERLVSDPDFARALAADPAAALAGYQLSAEELAVLTSEPAGGPGDEHGVEIRTNQSSLGGLLAPFPSSGGGGLDGAVSSGLGRPAEAESGFGAAPEVERGLGAAPEPERGFGVAPAAGGAGGGAGSGVGDAPELPKGYETRVDFDGDGNWDPHTLHAAPGGGVEIHVDLDGDGQVDVVGHDTTGDGLVNWAEYDRTGDGTFETRMYDDDGDGWMDRTETAE